MPNFSLYILRADHAASATSGLGTSWEYPECALQKMIVNWKGVGSLPSGPYMAPDPDLALSIGSWTARSP